MGISRERGSVYCTSGGVLRVNRGDSMHVVLFLKKRACDCERQQWGARLLAAPAEGGGRSDLAVLLWDSSAEWHLFHLTPAGRCDKKKKIMCQTVVRVLLDFFFFFYFFVISVAPLGEFQTWNHFSGRWWWEQAAASLPENFTSPPNKESVKDQSYDK